MNYGYVGGVAGGSGVIKGSVLNYTALPNPDPGIPGQLALYENQLWYTQQGEGGPLSWVPLTNIYKYPSGLYKPDETFTFWELTPINVKVSEDSLTLVNITNWAEWLSFAFDIGIGDRLIYNERIYTNITGTQTSTAPDTDTTNWGSYIVLNPQSSPLYKEGLIYYDSTKKALSYYNDESDITLNLGQEVIIPVYNDTGSTITNGTLLYPTGVNGDKHTVGLAIASEKDKCRLIAMATHDIENNTSGYVTRLGSVGDINTTGFTGTVYLSDSVAGGFQQTPPTGGSYVIPIGSIKEVGVSGSITVDPYIPELTVEVTDTNGFPPDQRTDTTISFDDGTRTFSIAPTGAMFHYYVLGFKFEKTTSQDIVIPDTEGLHAFYFDDGTLTTVANPNDGQIDQIIRTKAIVAYVYWDATNSVHNYFADERHGISMSPNTHAYLHFTRGAQFLSGLALNNILVDGSGDINTDAQFGTDAGFYADEDIITSPSAIGSTVGLPLYYLEGANADLRRVTNAGFSVLDDISAGVGATGRLVWNEYTGTVWQLSTITNNDFVLCHVFAINGTDTEDRLIAFIGQGDYGTLGQARAGAENELSNLLTILPVQEILPVGTIIYQTGNGYDNDVRARIRSTDTGDDYVDWRTSDLQAGVAPSSHNNLANLELAGTGILWGHVNSDYPLQLPELTTTERDLITPNEGMRFYNTTLSLEQRYINGQWESLIPSYIGQAGKVPVVNSGETALEFVSGTVPAGAVQMFAGSISPPGYLLCDGSAVSRITYSALFTAINTTWGVGDGSTTFNLPDMRGAAPYGVGTSTGYTQNETIALADKDDDQMQGHWHDLNANLISNRNYTGTGLNPLDAGSDSSSITNRVKNALADGINGTPRTGNVTHGKRIGINFIIKT